MGNNRNIDRLAVACFAIALTLLAVAPSAGKGKPPKPPPEPMRYTLFEVVPRVGLGASPLTESGYFSSRAVHGASSDSHATLWQISGTTVDAIDLGTLGGPESGAYDVNEAGVVVGVADTKTDGEYHPFVLFPAPGPVWFLDDDDDGANDLMIDLVLEPGTVGYATGINNSDQVVGRQNSDKIASFWLPPDHSLRMTLELPAFAGHPRDINDGGFILGYDNSQTQDFVWDVLNPGGDPDRLQIPADCDSARSREIVDPGHVVGVCAQNLTDPQNGRAVVWTLSGQDWLVSSILEPIKNYADSSATGMNVDQNGDPYQVVGISHSSRRWSSTLWEYGQGIDLEEITDLSGWQTINRGIDINDCGVITAEAKQRKNSGGTVVVLIPNTPLAGCP